MPATHDPRGPQGVRPLRALTAIARGALLKGRNVLSDTFSREPLYCKALAGESDYDICINSDMTVSCNCRDYDGQGHIGDLRSETLAEIFSGETVRRFQADLASHRFPTNVCSSCFELAPIPPERLAGGPVPGALPVKGVMVENTALCNLRCPMCGRDELLAIRTQHSMSLADVENVADLIAEHRIRQVSYFNLGEPFLSPTIRDEIAILRERNPDVRLVVSTNGALVEGDDKLEAALLLDYLYFSIDGVSQETLSHYQVRGDFERSFGNMRRLIERRTRAAEAGASRLPTIEWKYVLFRWNDQPEHIETALRLAKEAGVDLLGFYPGATERKNRSLRFQSDPFFATAGEHVDGGVVIDVSALE